jgi:hypothetical protein
MCLTPIATIVAALGKLPLSVLCRGKPGRGEMGSWDHPELKDVEAKGKLVW